MAVITSFSIMAGVGKRRPFSEQRGWAFAGGRPSRKSQEPVKLAPFGGWEIARHESGFGRREGGAEGEGEIEGKEVGVFVGEGPVGPREGGLLEVGG